MAARAPRRRILLPAAICLLAMGIIPADPVTAAFDDLLAGPLVDVAFVPHGDGSSPDLLTLEFDDGSGATAHVALLRHGSAGWSTLSKNRVPIARRYDAGNQPWIVELGNGRFAILATSQNGPVASIVPLFVDPSRDAGALFVEEPLFVDANLVNAGAADVDGDGRRELIASSWTEGDENGRCVDSTIHIFGRNGAEWSRSDHKVQFKGGERLRLTGAAFGEFDGRPGDDMLAHIYDTCQDTGDGLEPHHLVAIRLADGSIIKDIPSSDLDSPNVVPTAPRIIDVDGDGRDEAVIRGATDLAVIDPSDGWKRLALATGELLPLVARSRTTSDRAATATWLSGPAGLDPTVSSTRIRRVGGSLVADATTTQPLPDLAPEVRDFALARLRVDAGYLGLANMATVDVDGDDCPEVLLPAVIAACLGTGPISLGPAWANTRPLGLVGSSAEPRLLVAEGIDWYPSSDGPYPPTPSAMAPGAWREGWSPPFYLAEVGLPLADPGGTIPAPLFGAFTDKNGSIELHGPADTRLLFRISPLGEGNPSIDGGMTISDFMSRDTTENEFVFSRRIPAGGAIPMNLVEEASSTFGGGAERWVIASVVLDARGESSAVTRTTVVYDQTAPALTLDAAPLLSPPWPFEASITGKTEPGVTVRLGDGPAVIADASGGFEVTTRLAPWPQTLQAMASDPSGNSASATISVMGGVDVRGFPWPAIAAAGILVAVLLSSLRGTRRVRGIASVAAATDDSGSDLVIEELDPGSRYRRD